MVYRNPEFDLEKQGRPASKVIRILSSTPIFGVDNNPVSGHVSKPISSDWAYDYVKEQEEKDELRDLQATYNGIMVNERHSSNRQGYEQR